MTGQRGNGETLLEVLTDPLHERLHPVRCSLRGFGWGELGLPPRPSKVHDLPSCDLQRTVRVEVFLDEREREVHARGDARRGPDVLVVNEDRVRLDETRGVASLEFTASCPVGHGATPSEESGVRKQKCTGAYADNPPSSGRKSANDGHEGLRVGMTYLHGSRNNQRVDRAPEM